jgi:LPPG:FO 2-phospho-L-lactate transferase
MNGGTLLLSGGVGGARLADGFHALGDRGDLHILVNTGDDFEHLGLTICPDIDTCLYTLAGDADATRGWGLADESWRMLERLEHYGGDTWFQLGDRDLATHLYRTARLRAGEPLSRIIGDLAARLGLRANIFPMSDDPVRTVVHTEEGDLAFQHYFVRRRCEPMVRGFSYSGAADAAPAPALQLLAQGGGLSRIVLCPSNPFVSIGPILAVPAVPALLRAAAVPVLAVSPIIGGRALKGPAAVMLRQLGHEVSALGVARLLEDACPGLVDTFVVDDRDRELQPGIEALGMRCLSTDIVMRDRPDRQRLARWLLAATS